MNTKGQNVTSTPISKNSSPSIRRKSSLPTPFLQETNSFSLKRDRLRELEETPEPSKPRPRILSISRCFKRSLFNGPKVVGGLDEASFLSTPGYSDKAKQTYFQQCFQINRVLGQGSFGKVYKCTERLDGVEYAVKVCQGYNSRSVEEVRKHEALSSHTNCVRFFKAWEERKCLYIQMELCDESLGHYVARIHHKLAESEVWRILQNCLSGLDYLHCNGLLHMDVKPDNIFRCENRHIITYKLGDFGLAIASNELNTSDIIEGDSKYLAPELLEGRCDTKADIFSIGISVLELLAKVELPNNGAIWHALRNGHLPPTVGYSSSLKNIVHQMMDKNPDYRPSAKILLTNPSHRYYNCINFVKDKGSSVLSSIWSTWYRQDEQNNTSEDIFKDMEEIDDHIEIKEPQLTPILMKKINTESPTLSGGKMTPVWPNSPLLSPVRSHKSTPNKSILYATNKFESSTPIKSYLFDEEDFDELDEGNSFERPSLIKRNLLESFDDFSSS